MLTQSERYRMNEITLFLLFQNMKANFYNEETFRNFVHSIAAFDPTINTGILDQLLIEINSTRFATEDREVFTLMISNNEKIPLATMAIRMNMSRPTLYRWAKGKLYVIFPRTTPVQALELDKWCAAYHKLVDYTSFNIKDDAGNNILKKI